MLQISWRYLHLLFNSPKNEESRPCATLFSIRFVALLLSESWESSRFYFSVSFLSFAADAVREAWPTASPFLLVNSLNATGTFWCSFRDALSCVQAAADGLMNGDDIDYIFVKAGGLFSDPHYDTRVCLECTRGTS